MISLVIWDLLARQSVPNVSFLLNSVLEALWIIQTADNELCLHDEVVETCFDTEASFATTFITNFNNIYIICLHLVVRMYEYDHS